MIEVGPAGVRDVRLSEQVIPWTVVRNIRQVAVQRQVFVTLDLDPAFEREFLSGGAGLMQRLNNVSGFPGVHISRNGLAVSAELLYQTIEREWRSFLESR